MKLKTYKQCLKELWTIFEKTGSITAYLLYKDFNQKVSKQIKNRIKITKK